MDYEEALVVLDADRSSDIEQIERRFKSRASDLHPDAGGSNVEMAALIEARQVAIEHIRRQSALVPVAAIESALRAATSKLADSQEIRSRVEESKQQLEVRSTGRLRKLRWNAAIAAAVSGAALFLGKELPEEFFPGLTAQEEAQMSSDVLAAVEQRSYDIRRMWVLTMFAVAVYAGLGAWLCTARIQRSESTLQQLDEETATKSLFHARLADILGEKARSSWTLAEFASSLTEWSPTERGYKRLVRDVGELVLAQYLTVKGRQLGLLQVSESFDQGRLVEKYAVQVASDD